MKNRDWEKFGEGDLMNLAVGETLRIDTRDFHAIKCGDDFNGAHDYSTQIKTALKLPDYKLYFRDELHKAIREMKEKSGGDHTWRHIDLPGVSDSTGWNLKYLNIHKIAVKEQEKFLLLTNHGSIIGFAELDRIDYSFANAHSS